MMNKNLSRCDIPILITVFLSLGGLGMMLIFSGLIGFGIHSVIGKISLYICFGLQCLSVLVIFIRRHYLKTKYAAPNFGKKMHRFAAISFIIWISGAILLIFSLVMNVFFFVATETPVYYPCVIGACLVPIGWLGLLAAFHRMRESVIYADRQPLYAAR